jgi:hypothetical protein
MSRIILTEQATAPSTPASTKVASYVDNTALPRLKMVDDGGTVTTQIDNKSAITNAATAAVAGGYAVDTYLAGSNISIPTGRLPVIGGTYKCVFDMVKTGAGTATPILVIRYGTGGTVSDTARVTFTFAVGTGVIDSAIFEVWANFRVVGASAVLTAVARCTHHLAATGMTTTGASGMAYLTVTSGTFDSTVASSIIGCSFNGGASFSGTSTLVQSEWWNP